MVKLRCHWDADGITSGYLASFGIPNSEVEIGVYEKGFGNTEGLTKDDYMLDMRPQNPKWDGTCIDHHLPHPEDRKYELITENDEIPTTYLVWQKYKDKLPKRELWKVVIGLVGDGKARLIPTEVFRECPTLLRRVKTSVYERYGLKVNQYPLYNMLSSYINAFLRKGEHDSALNLLKFADNPMDIYTSDEARIAKIDISNDFKVAIKDSEIIDYGILQVVIFYSKYRMSGYISSRLQSILNDKTIMAINERNGSLSLRGDLAYYIKDQLKPLDYIEIDGHPGFCGGKLLKNYTTLLADLEELL